MTTLPAKVTAIEKLSDQYHVIVQINTKYRGSFNTLAFGEVKTLQRLSQGRPAGLGLLPGSRPERRGSVSALDSPLANPRKQSAVYSERKALNSAFEISCTSKLSRDRPVISLASAKTPTGL